jgi:predicted DNA-binding transcriptional regulator YafY
MRKAIRTFSIDAIESAETLSDAAKELSIKDVRKALGHGYGIFGGENVQWAKLRIGPVSARWVANTVWHPEQKSSFDEKGNYLLEVPFTDDRELIKDILGLLLDVEIVAPDALRDRLQSILTASLIDLNA